MAVTVDGNGMSEVSVDLADVSRWTVDGVDVWTKDRTIYLYNSVVATIGPWTRDDNYVERDIYAYRYSEPLNFSGKFKANITVHIHLQRTADGGSDEQDWNAFNAAVGVGTSSTIIGTQIHQFNYNSNEEFKYNWVASGQPSYADFEITKEVTFDVEAGKGLFVIFKVNKGSRMRWDKFDATVTLPIEIKLESVK